MKWTVLADNRTKSEALETEHGLSIWLDTGRWRVILDTGASDLFIRNAQRLGIDLATADYVFISHGHSDHAGGLRYLMDINSRAKVIVSPEALVGKFYSKRRYLHSITTQWPEIPAERLIAVSESCEIAEGLRVMAHIPQIHPMPEGNQYLFVEKGEGEYEPDDFSHELALYADGLLFTGCAHSGLENILACCQEPVETVLGGFHLLDKHETEATLTALAQRLMKGYPTTQFYTSHCTGDAVLEQLKQIMGEKLNAFCCGC